MTDRCEQSEITSAYGLQVLPESEIAAAEAHIASCPECQRELAAVHTVVDRFVTWPIDVLRPAGSLQARLARRTGEEPGRPPARPPAQRWRERAWKKSRRGSSASCSRPT